MIPPKRILATLVDNWSLIEALIKRFDFGDFSFQDAQSLLKKLEPKLSSEAVFKQINKLIQLEIIIPLAKSSQLEINRAIADFSQFLLQEESLGLVGEIHVLVDDLARLNQRLSNAGFNDDEMEIKRNARIMDERVRKIVKLFQHNQNAIFNLVEQAKSNDSNLTLAKRYKAVIEAFDEYIEPMLNMVDIGGEFKLCFEQIEASLSDLIIHFTTLGKFKHEKRQLEQLRSRILDMYLIGQQSLTKSADVLLPLREELRRNTQLTKQTSEVLALIRKQGVDKILGEFMPYFNSEAQRLSLGSNNQITAYMAELAEFEHDEYELPDMSAVNQYIAPNIPDYNHVKQRFTQAKRSKKASIMDFLTTTYDELETDELLYLYQKLASDNTLAISHGEQVTIQSGNKQLTLKPYLARSVSSD